MSQDDIMPLPRLKQVLALAESDSLGCAFGMSKDKKEVFLLVDKKAKGKKLADQLKNDGKGVLEPATLRFGELGIDPKADPGLVTFNVNKSAAGGTLPLMVRLVKKAGYQSIVINTDPALEEGEGSDAGAEAPAGAPPAPPPPPADGAAKLRLTALVQRIGPAAAADPSRREALVALAREAQEVLAAGQPVDAKLDALEAALGPAVTNGAAGGAAEAPKPTDGPAVALAKSSQLWRACRGQLRGKLDQLKAAILDAYADEPDVAAELKKSLGELDHVFDGLDTRLDDTLDAAISESDPAKRQALVAQSRVIIGDYAKYVASDPLLKALDDNPFGVSMGFSATVPKVLTALAGLSKTVN